MVERNNDLECFYGREGFSEEIYTYGTPCWVQFPEKTSHRGMSIEFPGDGRTHNIFVDNFCDENNSVVISHLDVEGFTKREKGFECITRIVIPPLSSSPALIYSEKPLKMGNSPVFKPLKQPQGGIDRVRYILSVSGNILETLLTERGIELAYQRELESFKISSRIEMDKICARIALLQEGKIKFKYVDLTKESKQQRPKYIHPPYITD